MSDNENETVNYTPVYVKTNFVMCHVSACRWDSVIIPDIGHYNDATPEVAAVIPCLFSIQQRNRLFLSRSFQKALNYTNTKSYEAAIRAANNDKKPSAIAVEALVKSILKDNTIKNAEKSMDDMIWSGQTTLPVNTIKTSSSHRELAILGDTERLSNAFMLAHMNKGGFVKVIFDPHKKDSEISYEKPQLAPKAAC